MFSKNCSFSVSSQTCTDESGSVISPSNRIWESELREETLYMEYGT